MSSESRSCPLASAAVVDRYFLEHRAKLIDIAAFFDRVERSMESGEKLDNRVAALRGAVSILIDGQSERSRRVLEYFSDLSTDPIPSAGGKGAIGVDPDRNYTTDEPSSAVGKA